MEQNGGSDWWSIAMEIARYVLGALLTVASSAVLWMSRKYHSHVAMLSRHEERLNQNDKELGEHREFRKTARDGPVGTAITHEIDELKAEDRRLHKRISSGRRIVDTLKEVITEMRTDLKWIRGALTDKRDDEE